MSKLTLAALSLALVAAACTDDTISNLGDTNTVANRPQAGQRITVMSRNLYMGTDPDALLTSPPDQIPLLVTQKWQEIQNTDFAARSKAIASEVVRTKPDVIGLQEADVFRIQASSDFIMGQVQPNATEVAQDYTAILLEELNARGMSYHLVTKQQGVDVELPMVVSQNPLRFADLRWTEYDVIIARDGVNIDKEWHTNYAVNAPLKVAGVPLNWKRGYVAARVVMGKDTVVFASTHQEIQPFRPVGEFQAQELVAFARSQTYPVIAVGDFNSAANADAPEESKTRGYQFFIDGGFIDLWATVSSKPGLTCCHAADLRSNTRDFDQRLDLILVRDPNVAFHNIFSTATMEVLGDHDKSANGMFPSDHAGVVGTLYFSSRLLPL